jgi:hypothetical protein
MKRALFACAEPVDQYHNPTGKVLMLLAVRRQIGLRIDRGIRDLVGGD